MKKALVLLMVLVMTIGLVACKGEPKKEETTEEAATAPEEADDSTEEAAAPSEEGAQEAADPAIGKKVGVLLPTVKVEFFAQLGEACKEVLGAAGCEVNVVSFEHDSAQAVASIENFITDDVDVILAMITDASTDDALKQAMDAGIGVLLAGVDSAHRNVVMVADNRDAGTKIAEMAVDWVNENFDGKTKICTFVNTASADMAERAQGICTNCL